MIFAPSTGSLYLGSLPTRLTRMSPHDAPSSSCDDLRHGACDMLPHVRLSDVDGYDAVRRDRVPNAGLQGRRVRRCRRDAGKRAEAEDQTGCACHDQEQASGKVRELALILVCLVMPSSHRSRLRSRRARLPRRARWLSRYAGTSYSGKGCRSCGRRSARELARHSLPAARPPA